MLEDTFFSVSSAETDILVCHVSLDSLFHLLVTHCRVQILNREFTFEEFNELVLDEEENLPNLSLSPLR